VICLNKVYVFTTQLDVAGENFMLVRILAFLNLFISGATFASEQEKSAYDFSFQTIEGQPLPLSAYTGKVLMVVNTASFCGFTRQYKSLQEVWDRYRNQGLVVLGVPSNDFGGQEPGSLSEIKQFCELNYGIDFPMTTKIRVRGKAAHPFYQWAAQQMGAQAKPRWNFHKYIVGRDGRLAAWFASSTKPSAKRVSKAIEKQLSVAATAGR